MGTRDFIFNNPLAIGLYLLRKLDMRWCKSLMCKIFKRVKSGGNPKLFISNKLCTSNGAKITRTPLLSANETAHSGFEAKRRRHQEYSTGVSVASQKGLMSSKKCFKKFAKII